MSLDLGTLTGYLELDDKGFESVLSKLPGKLGGSSAAMGVAAGLLAAGIGLAISGGISQGIDLENARAQITAQLGLTAEESARIGSVAGQLYADAYGESIEEVNTAVASVVSSFDGLRNASGKDIEDTTAKLLNLQTAMGIDVARSAQVAGQAVKNGLAGDANTAIDLLAANLQRVPAALREDLLDAVDEYGPILANMGYSGEEAFGMLADAADKGMYGIDKTGDALKELSIRASDMSTASVAAYEAAGLNAEEMATKMQTGGASAREATEQIIQGLLGIQDPVAQSNAAIALFGTPLEDLGTQEIPTFLDSLAQVKDGFGETAGAADEMGATLGGTVQTGWTTLSRTWDSIVGQLGQALLPILGNVADVLNENPALLQVVAVALGILALAFIGLTVATWAMNTALLASPITWIVLGIVALIAAIVLLVMNWDQVVAFITDIWNGFIAWLAGVMMGVVEWWRGIWASIIGYVTETWNNIVSFVSGGINRVVAIIAGAGSWLITAGRNLIGGLLNGVQSMWSGFMSFLGGIPGAVGGFFAGIGSWLFNAGRDLINGLLNGVKSLAGTIGNFFLGLLPGWIVAPFKAALGIRSPSRVFAGYGRNIVQGLVMGLDDEQEGLDARMGNLVSVPSSTAASWALSASGGYGPGSRVSTSSLTIHGNVGWDAEEVARQTAERQRQAAALAGLNELVAVA